ncbi:hypothetical protein BKA69DRAFT_1121531 [Paraphysoderma sedebokerense]|nr:hypothetical protein BKA69DRAFT_1121531 [Paraphysoderma sedebokerense]
MSSQNAQQSRQSASEEQLRQIDSYLGLLQDDESSTGFSGMPIIGHATNSPMVTEHSSSLSNQNISAESNLRNQSQIDLIQQQLESQLFDGEEPHDSSIYWGSDGLTAPSLEGTPFGSPMSASAISLPSNFYTQSQTPNTHLSTDFNAFSSTNQSIPESNSMEVSSSFGNLISAANLAASEFTNSDASQYNFSSLNLDDLVSDDENDETNGDMAAEREEFEAEFKDGLKLQSGVGRRRGRRRRDPNDTDEVRTLLGQANAEYVVRNYIRAIEILQEVIRVSPNAYKAWFTLAMIHEEMGNLDKALKMYLVAAHLTPKDATLWKKLALLSRKEELDQQAIYCYSKAITADPKDSNTVWHRNQMYLERGELTKAVDGYKLILKNVPHNLHVVRELTKLYIELKQVPEAIKVFEAALEHQFKEEKCDMWLPPPSPSWTATAHDQDTAMPLAPKSSTPEYAFAPTISLVNDVGPSTADASIEPEIESSSNIGYTEINIMAELYIMNQQYLEALRAIKFGLRAIQNRRNEVHWDDVDDDSEYDMAVVGTRWIDEGLCDAGAGVPLDLRIKMGICRVWLKYPDVAKDHFQYLFRQPPEEFPDLYLDVAEAYMEQRMWKDALDVYSMLAEVDETSSSHVWSQMAVCHHQLGDTDTAIECYNTAIEANPDNNDAKLALAELYQSLGDEDAALELMTEVDNAAHNPEFDSILFPHRRRRRQRKSTRAMGDESDNKDHSDQEATLFNEAKAPRDERSKRFKVSTKKDALRGKEKEVKLKFKKCGMIWEKWNDAGDDKRNEFIKTAGDIFNTFRNTSTFYPSDRLRTFIGVDPETAQFKSHKISDQMKRTWDNVEKKTKLPQLGARQSIEPEQWNNFTDEEKQIYMAKSYLGYSFDEWFDLILRYLISLTESGQHQLAHEVALEAADSNVFYHDQEKLLQLKLFAIAVALHANDYEKAADLCRWFCSYMPYRSDVYRIYCSIFSGLDGTTAFASSNVQKFMKRQLQYRFSGKLAKNLDTSTMPTSSTNSPSSSSVASATPTQSPNFSSTLRPISTSLSVPANPLPSESQSPFGTPGLETSPLKPRNIWNAKPILLTLYGHILSCARSYLPAIAHLTRAYALSPKDPMINFALGTAYLSRAMQRKTDNRHMQIAQGFMFLFRYFELRGGDNSQEANYNIARSFHQIGLTHLAVGYYERVLELATRQKEQDAQDSNQDSMNLSKEAAYNLSLIYVASGNHSLAKQVLMNHCRI